MPGVADQVLSRRGLAASPALRAALTNDYTPRDKVR
jgi:hypothetical protein